jgi:hypothetical protein
VLAYPMLALELFARPVFALSVVGSICSFTAQNLTFVSLPFFLEEVLGRSAVETGLLMTPGRWQSVSRHPSRDGSSTKTVQPAFSAGSVCGILAGSACR